MRIVLVGVALLATAMPALAHTGGGSASGFVAGFGHPLLGLDHLLAMVAVGLFAAVLGGRALWLVPASFVAMMAVGGLLALDGVGLPMVETGIALSVVVLGAAVALRVQLPVAAAMAVCGAFALFHGHAHGTEMPAAASAASYAAGLVIATAVLHATGVGLGLLASRASRLAAPWAIRTAGSLVALLGGGLLAGLI